MYMSEHLVRVNGYRLLMRIIIFKYFYFCKAETHYHYYCHYYKLYNCCY